MSIKPQAKNTQPYIPERFDFTHYSDRKSSQSTRSVEGANKYIKNNDNGLLPEKFDFNSKPYDSGATTSGNNRRFSPMNNEGPKNMNNSYNSGNRQAFQPSNSYNSVNNNNNNERPNMTAKSNNFLLNSPPEIKTISSKKIGEAPDDIINSSNVYPGSKSDKSHESENPNYHRGKPHDNSGYKATGMPPINKNYINNNNNANNSYNSNNNSKQYAGPPRIVIPPNDLSEESFSTDRDKYKSTPSRVLILGEGSYIHSDPQLTDNVEEAEESDRMPKKHQNIHQDDIVDLNNPRLIKMMVTEFQKAKDDEEDSESLTTEATSKGHLNPNNNNNNNNKPKNINKEIPKTKKYDEEDNNGEGFFCGMCVAPRKKKKNLENNGELRKKPRKFKEDLSAAYGSDDEMDGDDNRNGRNGRGGGGGGSGSGVDVNANGYKNRKYNRYQ